VLPSYIANLLGLVVFVRSKFYWYIDIVLDHLLVFSITLLVESITYFLLNPPVLYPYVKRVLVNIKVIRLTYFHRCISTYADATFSLLKHKH